MQKFSQHETSQTHPHGTFGPLSVPLSAQAVKRLGIPDIILCDGPADNHTSVADLVRLLTNGTMDVCGDVNYDTSLNKADLKAIIRKLLNIESE